MKKIIRALALPLVLAVTFGVAALHLAGAQDKKDKDKAPAKEKAATAAVFELYKDAADEFRFRLKDDEGTLLATSGKGYKTKADCQKVIDEIKSLAAKAKVEDETKK
jgi:uncharacterized protein YegP (UPF0339 family)